MEGQQNMRRQYVEETEKEKTIWRGNRKGEDNMEGQQKRRRQYGGATEKEKTI